MQVNDTQSGFALCIIYTSLAGLLSKHQRLILRQALHDLIQRSRNWNKKKEKSVTDMFKKILAQSFKGLHTTNGSMQKKGHLA